MSIAEKLLSFGLRKMVEVFIREVENPNGWEADPRTRTIRRKRPPKPPPPTRATTTAQSIIDVCGECMHIEADCQCPK